MLPVGSKGKRGLNMKKKIPDQLVQSLDRAIDIIEKVIESNRGYGVTELSNSLGLHKSTVYRLLATLAYRGYVEKNDKNDRYRPGVKMIEISSSVLNNYELRTKIKPYLIQLRQKTKETVHLGILDNLEVVYIDKVETNETIRMYSRVGKRAPLHCTSLGKVLIAYTRDEQLVNDLIGNKGLKGYTDNTIIDSDKFKDHLKEIRKRGYAVDNEEHEKGIRCISAPIFDFSGDLIAAFSIAGPTTRMTKKRVDELVSLVKTFSRDISTSFGYYE